MTPHISAKQGEIANLVIMPGDPKRAKYIAENYLRDYKLVSDVRNIYVYTGYYKDKKVTVMASGMGMPSMGIYAYELFNFYEVEKIIRVGTCGSLKENINLNDILLAEKSYTNSNITLEFNKEIKNEVYSNDLLNEKVLSACKINNIEIKKANIYTTDAFYKNDYDYSFDAVEMETFMLLYLANHFKKEATSILTVSDSIISKDSLSSLEREKTLDRAIIIALEAL